MLTNNVFYQVAELSSPVLYHKTVSNLRDRCFFIKELIKVYLSCITKQPIISETADASDANLKVLKYDRSPIMPTYLVAFVVGEYDFVEKKDENGVLIRVYTPVGKKEQGQFALDVSFTNFQFYQDY